jgi:hypothetical protein
MLIPIMYIIGNKYSDSYFVIVHRNHSSQNSLSIEQYHTTTTKVYQSHTSSHQIALDHLLILQSNHPSIGQSHEHLKPNVGIPALSP